MSITATTVDDAEVISAIISESNKDVAEAFGLNINNNPKHPSFYNKDWVLSDLDRGEEYFVYQHGATAVGCVAVEIPRPGIAYLNRLSVLPEYRRNGVGEALVRFIFRYAKIKNIEKVSIGIIAEHIKLRNWYLKLGFIEGERKHFPHLPFEVLYMSYGVQQ